MKNKEQITVVSCMRDEGPYLLEWLAHHHALGVSRFVIFTNDCADGTDALLEMMAPYGVIHVPLGMRGGAPVQWQALAQASTMEAVQSADWVIGIDCDEWINLSAPMSNLHDLIARIDGDAITLRWRLFGHAGHIQTPPDQLSAQAYRRAAPVDLAFPVDASYFKTLHRVCDDFTALGVHRPKQVQEACPSWVDGSGRALPTGFAKQTQRITLWGHEGDRALVSLNHYSVRSVEAFMSKRARGLPNHTRKPVDLAYWTERNFNTVEEPSIERLLPATQAVLQDMFAIKPLREGYEAARAWHKDRFRAALKTPEGLRLFGQLVLAAGSHAAPMGFARQMVQHWDDVTKEGRPDG